MDFAPVVILALILYMVAEVLKQTVIKSDEQRTLLPFICGIAGGVIGATLFYIDPSIMGASNVLAAIGNGIASGLVATGGNQIYKQFKLRLAGFNSDSDSEEE